jgi:hypothetical protein
MSKTSQLGADTVITFDNTNSVTLSNVQKTNLISDNFLFG